MPYSGMWNHVNMNRGLDETVGKRKWCVATSRPQINGNFVRTGPALEIGVKDKFLWFIQLIYCFFDLEVRF